MREAFEDAVLLAVNLGDDGCTTVEPTGQFAGAMCGYSVIEDTTKSGHFGERRLHLTIQFFDRNTIDPRSLVYNTL